MEELNARLKEIHPKVTALTFHKLGYDQIKNHLSVTPVVTNENTLGNIIKQYLLKDIFSNSNALNALFNMLRYMNILKNMINMVHWVKK